MFWNLQTIGELGCFISEGCVYLFLGKGTCTHEVGSPEVGSLAHAGDGRPGNGFPSRADIRDETRYTRYTVESALRADAIPRRRSACWSALAIHPVLASRRAAPTV